MTVPFVALIPSWTMVSSELGVDLDVQIYRLRQSTHQFYQRRAMLQLFSSVTLINGWAMLDVATSLQTFERGIGSSKLMQQCAMYSQSVSSVAATTASQASKRWLIYPRNASLQHRHLHTRVSTTLAPS